jgi:branched-chain amino acid transport system substrate-binding protein
MSGSRVSLAAGFALVIASVFATGAFAAGGVSADRIVFGQVAALDGPAQALGKGMRQGIVAAFDEANRKGGVNGRKLELKSVDDGYEPERAIEAVKSMLADDRVFALAGTVGTPTAQAVQPIATDAKIPLIGPFTGADFLRHPYNRYVVNLRASYFQETETWIEHLTHDLGVTKIAILYQDDAFGIAGLEGVKQALSKRNMSLVATGSFKRNTIAVKSALLDIMEAKPQAVVTVGPYKPVAEFIRLARQINFDPVFAAISFVGSDALAQELAGKGEGVIVSQVVPYPWDNSLPLVASYQAALAAVDGKPGFVSLEGYLVGRLVVAALGRVQGEPTREAFLDVFSKGGAFDLDGIKLTYGPDKNQGMDKVFLTVLQADGTFKPVTRLVKTAAR